ncbi:hypothetical protein L3K75_14370, partial [[Ruminococcus] lactaris]|nr:hypothetical protein [[Ruminococcus] lactaris]
SGCFPEEADQEWHEQKTEAEITSILSALAENGQIYQNNPVCETCVFRFRIFFMDFHTFFWSFCPKTAKIISWYF